MKIKKLKIGLVIGAATLLAGLVWLLTIPSAKSIADPYASLILDEAADQSADSIQSYLNLPELKASGTLSNPLKCRKMHITTQIDQGIATTDYDLVYYNPNDKILEANFEMPLSAGSVISSFELQINHQMRKAVAVEKQQARIAYETTVRKGIDPGLVEHNTANLFKMRVFPLQPRQSKRIRVQVTTLLKSKGPKAQIQYSLMSKQAVSRFNFSATQQNGNEFRVLKEIATNNEKINNSFTLDFSANEDAIQHYSRGDFDYIRTTIQIPKKYAKKAKPKCITVFWDVSRSRLNAQLVTEKKLLKEYLHWVKKGRLEFLFFAHEVLQRHTFSIQNGTVKELDSLLDNVNYDGATVLSSLPFGKVEGQEIILFSDGIQTIAKPPKLKSSVPIYSVTSAQVAQNGFLENLAASTNGSYLDLKLLGLDHALQQLQRRYLKFLGFREKIPALEYYQHPIGAQNLLLILKNPKSTTLLTAQFGLDKDHILNSQKIKVKRVAQHTEFSDLYRQFQLLKLAALEKEPEKNHDQILTLGLKQNVVSSATSLLVLDELEDYIQHSVLPPKEMRAAYYKALKNDKSRELKQSISHLQKIKKEWIGFQRWYKKPPISTSTKISLQASTPNALLTTPVIQDSSLRSTPDTINIKVDSINTATAVLNTNAFGTNSYTWTNASVSANSVGFDAFNSSGSYTMTLANACASTQGATTAHAKITLAAWNPKTPYLSKLRTVSLDRAYSKYIELSEKYANQPSFYIDVADYFAAHDQNNMAIRVLGNLSEMQLKEVALMRVLAQKLLQLKAYDLAIKVLIDVVDLRPEEPQSYRDYALALAQIGEFNKAVKILYTLVSKEFDARFEGIHLIALNEINHLLKKHPNEIQATYIPTYFKVSMPMDIRVVLDWDQDNTDVDLWVNEPNGEKCMYTYQLTKNGGRISNDFTQGYGPEEYLIRKAPKGTYRIQAHFFGDYQPALNGKAILTVHLYKYYGTAHEKHQVITRRLETVDQEIDLATFTF